MRAKFSEQLADVNMSLAEFCRQTGTPYSTAIKWHTGVSRTPAIVFSWINLYKQSKIKADKLVIQERPFKVGDEVWSFEWGKGTVEMIFKRTSYPIRVNFSSKGKRDSYTKNGALFAVNPRCLFHLDVAERMGWVDMQVIVEDENE